MSKITKALIFGEIILALVIGILAAQSAQGRQPYLPLVGPPPLRLEMPATNTPAILAELALPMPESETDTNQDTTKTAANKNELPFAPPPILPAATLAAANMYKKETVVDTAQGAPPTPNPASNMLNIAPQMYNQYFMPTPGGGAVAGPNGYQTGDTVLVPAELGFVPPLPPQSRAVYKSQ
jgi:hypothetical protein